MNLAGRTFGHTEVLFKLKKPGSALWQCRCDLCGQEYECLQSRIEMGYAAKHGCGCRRTGPSVSVRPPPPTPRQVGIPFARRNQSE